MQSLIIGTAQWGLDYGATNTFGRLSDQTIAAILERASLEGPIVLDTAPAYGDAEARIGALDRKLTVQTKVTTSGLSQDSVRDSIRTSLALMSEHDVTAVLVHDWASLDRTQATQVAAWLEEARAEGLVREVGVSAYEAADLDLAIDSFGQLDIVQVPVNVLDQRLQDAPQITALKENGTRVQARSVFLQGVALGLSDTAPFGTHPDVRRLRAVRESDGVDAIELCLDYVRTRTWIDEVLLAPTSVAECDELLRAWSRTSRTMDWTGLASTDEALLDPRSWS